MVELLVKNSAQDLIAFVKKMQAGKTLSREEMEQIHLTLTELKTAIAEGEAAISREKQVRIELEKEKSEIIKQIGEEGLVKIKEYRSKLKEGIADAKNAWWDHLKSGDLERLEKDHLWISNAELDLKGYNQTVKEYQQIIAKIDSIEESIDNHKSKNIEFEELLNLYEELLS
jgi:hypothetical protein